MITHIINIMKKCITYWKNMSVKKKVKILSAVILFINLLTMLLFYPECWKNQVLRYYYIHYTSIGNAVFSIFYLILQLLLLFYAAKLQNKFIYYFPIHWGFELWRILHRFLRLNYLYLISPIGKFLYRYPAQLLWGADEIPSSIHLFDININSYPILISLGETIKFIIAIIVLAVSVVFCKNSSTKNSDF